eukprot:6491569-Amphidinium_carterae.2
MASTSHRLWRSSPGKETTDNSGKERLRSSLCTCALHWPRELQRNGLSTDHSGCPTRNWVVKTC